MPSNLQLGANLPVVHDWQGTSLFTNLILQSRDVSSYEDPAEIPASNIRFNASGYPLDPFGIVVKAPLQPGDEGLYRLKFRGKAAVQVLPGAITLTPQITEGDWQVTDLTLPAAALTTQPGYKEPILMLRFSDLQGQAVSDISLVKKDLLRADGTFPTFHPTWIAHLRRFKTLRFMNWMSYWLPMPAMDWADRPKKDRLSQAGNDAEGVVRVRGVAPEYIVELANEVGCDVWVNIPPLATDDYVRGLAAFLKDNLPAAAKIYVEYGNEIWASGWQGQANRALALDEVAHGNSDLAAGGVTSEYTLAIRRYARRTKEIGDLFGAVFNTTTRNRRIRPVYCYQSVNPDATLQPGLDFLTQGNTPLAASIWGIAPKTGVDEGGLPGGAVTKSDVLRAMRAGLAAIVGGYAEENTPVPVLEQAAAVAAWHSVSFAGYEGGIGFARAGNIPPEVAWELMNDWEISAICAEYLQAWYAYGSDNLLCWFIAGASHWRGATLDSKPDIHGLTWNINEQNTLPIRALDEALARTGGFETLAGRVIPGRVDARAYAERMPGWNDQLRNNRRWHANGKLYLLNALSTKQYAFTLVSERNPNNVSQTTVWVDNQLVATVNVPVGNGSHSSSVFKVWVRKGLHALRMEYDEHWNGNYYLQVQ